MAQIRYVGRHATKVFKSGKWTVIQYHQTPVVTFNDEIVILNNGDWITSTTRNRMNQASNQFGLSYQVHIKDYWWMWVETFDGKFKKKFVNYAIILANGEIISDMDGEFEDWKEIVKNIPIMEVIE